MAMRSAASRLSLLAGRRMGAAALRPLQSTAMHATSSDTQRSSDKDYLLGTLPETMKAAVLWEPRKPMTIEDLKMPRPQIGEVLIRTKGMITGFHSLQVPVHARQNQTRSSHYVLAGLTHTIQIDDNVPLAVINYVARIAAPERSNPEHGFSTALL